MAVPKKRTSNNLEIKETIMFDKFNKGDYYAWNSDRKISFS
jgi:hypothetical protein